MTYKTYYLLCSIDGKSDGELSQAYQTAEAADDAAALLLKDCPGGAILLLEATKRFTAHVVRETQKLKDAPQAYAPDVATFPEVG
jgi:hypothetical protein